MKSILYGRSGKWIRRIGQFLVDLCLVCLSAYAALLLRLKDETAGDRLSE